MKCNLKLLFLAFAAFVPIVTVDLSLLLFWYTQAHSHTVWSPEIGLAFTGLFFPLYLSVVGSVFVWRNMGEWILSGFLVLVVAVLFAVFSAYSDWGISTGLFWSPDGETVGIMELVGLVALVVAIIPPIFVLLFRRLFLRFKRHA